jgi:hypothetical protein
VHGRAARRRSLQLLTIAAWPRGCLPISSGDSGRNTWRRGSTVGSGDGRLNTPLAPFERRGFLDRLLLRPKMPRWRGDSGHCSDDSYPRLLGGGDRPEIDRNGSPRAMEQGCQKESRPRFRWLFVGGSAHKRSPQFGGRRIAAAQRYFFWSGRRDSNPRPPPWQWHAGVSCLSAGLTSPAELRVLGGLVSSISPDRWSRLDFVGDFVGAFPPRPIPRKKGDHPTQQCRAQGVPAEGSPDPSPFGAPHRASMV